MPSISEKIKAVILEQVENSKPKEKVIEIENRLPTQEVYIMKVGSKMVDVQIIDANGISRTEYLGKGDSIIFRPTITLDDLFKGRVETDSRKENR
jgi:hypothetical protein